MAYKRFRRYPRRSYKPSYTVQRRVLSFSPFTQSPGDPQNWNSATQLLLNPSDGDTIIQNGGNKTVKHIEVQLLQRPTWEQRISDTAVQYHYPGVVWMAVYVPEGTNPSVPFGTVGITQTALYEPAQYVLGTGVIPDNGYYFVEQSAGTSTGDYKYNGTSGNATRIRVPLSKKLNPGDSIYFIMAVVNAAFDGASLNSGGKLLVKYALKYNYYVCYKKRT